MNRHLFLAACCAFALGTASATAEPFSITDALLQAVQSNPGVGEASANRRATESELRQTQSTLLPQVRLEAKYGPEKYNQAVIPEPIGNGDWRNGRAASVVVRQLLFDGFASIHDIWRQSARVNAAAFRVRERTELIALDAAEAYIDVVRYLRLVTLAEQNVANHENIFANVKSRFDGGRAGEGDLQQALERVESAKAALAEFQRSLEDARAKYRKVVGIEAFNLRFPGPLAGLPVSRDDSLAIAAYRKEYELGQRSLIDLLNAENQYFNAAVSLTSARGVIVFADYQLLAATGTLLDYLKTAPPVDAAPLDTIPFGLLPTKIAPIILTLPETGSAPLNVATPEIAPAIIPAYPAPSPYPPIVTFTERWQQWSGDPTVPGAREWLARQNRTAALNTPATSTTAMSFGPTETFASRETGTPTWLGMAIQGVKANP